MKKKRFVAALLCLLMLGSLFHVSAVTADGSEPKDDADVLEVYGWLELEKAVAGLTFDGQPVEAKTIRLIADACPSTYGSGIKVKRDLTIDLNGYRIDLNSSQVNISDHVIEVFDGVTLTIVDNSAEKTGIITGGQATDGGGIYVQGEGTLILKGGTITKNEVSKDGAGVYVNGTMQMTGGCITDNTAHDDGGGIHVGPDGTLIFDGGVISDNKATGDGGGISVYGALTHSDEAAYLSSVIENNSADKTGGGIYVDDNKKATLSLAHATISGNTAEDGDAGGGGLNVHLKEDATGTIEYCTITGNTTSGSGGGIRMTRSGRTLEIVGTTIADNTADKDAGGIYAREGTVMMAHSTISGNTAGAGGGGVNVKGGATFTATDTVIEGNKTEKEEGGGVKNCGTATLTDCVIIGNSANTFGGGICNIKGDEANLTINSCIISDNSGSKGGGVYTDYKLAVMGYTIIGESTSESGEVIPGNTATDCGGGMFITGKKTSIQGGLKVVGNFCDSADNLYLDDGNVLTCTGLLDGAWIGVDLYSGTGTVTYQYGNQGTPSEQFFVTEGYYIAVEGGEVTITSDWDTVKTSIESLSDGGSFQLMRSSAAASDEDRIIINGQKSVTVDLNGYTLNRNRLTIIDDGHVFEVFPGSTLTIVDSSTTGTITGGWSNYGGAIYVHEGGTLNICGGNITGNTAKMRGGGIYLKEGAALNLQAGKIHGNSAGKYGGGVYLQGGALISAEGSPVVQDNDSTILGDNIFLPSDARINITGELNDEAQIGITLENDWGQFTSGYSDENGAADPGMFFTSDEDFQVVKDNSEAAFGMDTFGGTDDEEPFIERGDQMRADTDALSGCNWMAGISGERYLNEINLPGSHDAGMKNVQRIGKAIDKTSVLGLVPNGVGYNIGANLALTQTSYIDRQLKDGARVFDLRLTDRYKKGHYNTSLLMEEYNWANDKENVWVCHGDSVWTGCYLACNKDGEFLNFLEVLDWVKDFLMKHPTETVILHMRHQSIVSGHSDTIYARTRNALEQSVLENNPSTGEPFLYKEPGSEDFAPYTHMPKLADCRGKIVLMFEYQSGVDKCGGFTTKGLYGDNYYDPTDHTLDAHEQIRSITNSYNNMNNDGSVKLPADANTNCDFLWHWELNCTGESNAKYYIAGILLGLNPINLAHIVNPALVGNGKLFGPRVTGRYIGWVKMDAFEAKYAEAIWRTNFFDGLQYCTVTVQSGVDDPGFPTQTYRLLKGTTITIPGNIYKNPHPCEGAAFAGWLVGEDTKQPGAEITVTTDMTVTAVWEGIPIMPTFKSHSLVLSGQIGVNFFMDLPAIDGVDYAESYMTFEISGKGTVPSDPVPYDPTHTNAKSTYYGFSCYVNSIQMADTITATFHYGEGQTVSETYSIRQYIESFDAYNANTENVPFDDETIALVHALADYGHYIQPFLSATRGWTIGNGDDQYAEMDLFYAESYDIDAVKTAVADYAIQRSICGDIEKFTYCLLMDSETAICMYFKPIAGYSGSFSVTIDGDTATATKQKDGRYLVKIPNIGAHMLDDTYTVAATTAGGSSTVEVSALSYVNSFLNAEAYQNNTAAQYAAAAIYHYYAAAVAYKTVHP